MNLKNKQVAKKCSYMLSRPRRDNTIFLTSLKKLRGLDTSVAYSVTHNYFAQHIYGMIKQRKTVLFRRIDCFYIKTNIKLTDIF